MPVLTVFNELKIMPSQYGDEELWGLMNDIKITPCKISGNYK